ncbi:hypothetical protein SAMN06295974_3848 [Plantibacter flavus]|uniref:Uncharacterized protein n=1 Tax=Plantibacter flavus TaxID=150123 RepID=A0A3N2BL67_9MICO|nr:hypothetical protein [Plantibacter flavus]ROR76006.1 hypothetical protein EDD42_3958 [Plantibacter flavus]SMG49400.1 hypothetical protein SAMN06295974_3848 [Plantibacter flavus]
MKHLMLIEDGSSLENSLHLSDRTRAARLIDLLRSGDLGDSVASDANEALIEADLEAAAADYPEGVSAQHPRPEDYVDTLRDVLSDRGIDMYLDDLDAPTEVSTA